MTISIIIPSYNEEGNIIELNKALTNTLKNIDYELIYINDGSTDKTLSKIKEIYELDKEHIKYISLSRNFGKDAAIYAGLKYSKGKYTCIIDSDLQQNPKYIISMYNHLKNNPDTDQIVMVMKNRNNESFINRKLKNCFYKFINRLSDTKLVDGASDFRMFNKSVKDAILSLSENNRFSKGIFSWVGFNTEYMYYNVEKRFSGKTKFNTKNQFKYAITAITNYSIKPLQLSTIIGIVISFFSLIYIIITLLQITIYGKDVPGYASLLIVSLFMGGLQLIFIGILGTYLGKTYTETKNRPLYIEKEIKGFDEIL